MNITKQEQEFKKYLKLDREYTTLIRQKWALKPIKLDKPINNGFVRFLRIRPEYYQHVDYKYILNAFELIGSKKVFSKTKDFHHRDRRKRKLLGEQHAHLKYFIDPRFKYYITNAKQEADYKRIADCKQYIKPVYTIYQCNCIHAKHGLKDFVPHYEFAIPWMVEEKTDIHWLTHYTPIDNEIESKLTKINQYMYQHNGWNKISGRYNDDYDLGIIFLKEKIHGYLHGWPRPRIDELYEWETTFRLDKDSD